MLLFTTFSKRSATHYIAQLLYSHVHFVEGGFDDPVTTFTAQHCVIVNGKSSTE